MARPRFSPRLVLVGGLLAVAMLPGRAAGREDCLRGTRGEVKETGHDIRITMHHGHAVLVVRRTMWNWGLRADQAVYTLAMPDWAVATGLRSRGIVNGKPVWFDGDLLEAEAAAAKYRKLTGLGGHYPKDPALLSWIAGPGRDLDLELQVFPLAPGQPKMVEYTLTVPTRYRNGRDVLVLPRMGLPCHNPELFIHAADSRDTLWLNEIPFPQGGHAPWPRLTSDASAGIHDAKDEDAFVAEESEESSDEAPDGKTKKPLGEPAPFVRDDACSEVGAERATIALQRAHMSALGGRLAVQPFAKNKVLVHYQVETPVEFAPVPVRPSVVVLLDDSRSMDARDQWAGAAAIRQILTRMPDARVAVFAFSRHVRSITKGFVAAPTAAALLRTYRYLRDNGSAVDGALRKADELLVGTPLGAPRRVYLLSDLRTRTSLDPSRLRAIFRRSGAVVHIATLTDGEPSLLPARGGAWGKVAQATGGLAWTGNASTDSSQHDPMARVYEEWVRPTRLYHWDMTTPTLTDEDPMETDGEEKGEDEASLAKDIHAREEDELAPGVSLVGFGVASENIAPIRMQGELWSRKVQATLRPDPKQARIWSALVFRSLLLDVLSEEEMMVLAKQGRAVSPVTSYLAIEPGVRPSTEGFDEAFGVGGLGLVGTGTGGGGTGEGTIGLGEKLRTFNPQRFLENLLSNAWADCGGGKEAASLTLENTGIEVVDVLKVKALDKNKATCLQEAAWKFLLPEDFREHDQRMWELQVRL